MSKENEKLVTIKVGGGEEVEGQYIDLTESKTIYATAKAPFHKEGDEMVVHPKMAEKFIAAGVATEKKGDKK